jgi:hypothetical protein
LKKFSISSGSTVVLFVNPGREEMTSICKSFDNI